MPLSLLLTSPPEIDAALAPNLPRMGSMCSTSSTSYVVNGGPPTTKDGVPLPTRGVAREWGGHAGDGGGPHWRPDYFNATQH